MAALPHDLEPVILPSPAVRVQRWTWRLVLLSAAIGALSALAAALVRLSFKALQHVLVGTSIEPPLAASHLHLARRALTPIAGACLASATLWLRNRHFRQQGQSPAPYVEYVEAVRHEHGQIPLVPNLWRTLSAAFSVATGAAVGREGSMIQFASAVSSVVGRSRALVPEPETAPLGFLVACGVAGGVTAAYNAPLAAIFFAAEIVLGNLQALELPLLGLAAGAGWLVTALVLGRKPLYPTHPTLVLDWHLALLPVLALALGLAGPAYQWLLGRVHARKLPGALLWGGLAVGLCSLADPRVWGNGDAGLSAALGRAEIPGIALTTGSLLRVLALRLVATSACVWTGTIGGVFTPTLFLGGTLGALAGRGALGTATALWAVVGMSCLMAAVTHAPLMASCIAAELTGDWTLLPLLLPLTFLARAVARRLSPRALYAIASQAPQHAPAQPADLPPAQQNGTVTKA